MKQYQKPKVQSLLDSKALVPLIASTGAALVGAGAAAAFAGGVAAGLVSRGRDYFISRTASLKGNELVKSRT